MPAYMNPNQFGLTPILGMTDLQTNPNTVSVLLNPDSVATGLSVGQAVKLISGTSPQILVDEAGSADEPYGVILFSLKKNTYTKGQTVEIGARGTVVYLNSAAAINRGATVENVPATPGNVQTKASGAKLGIALDQASGANQLIRVLIEPGAA